MSRFRPSRNYISGEVVFEGGPVDISGDLIVSGTITANEYQVNVINTNVTHIDADGNTKFGDSPDDTHIFTGSVFIVGALSASSIVGGGATTPGAPDTSVQYNDAGAFAGDPNFTWNDGTSTLAVTGDISGSGNISGSSFYGDGSNLTNLPSAAITTYDTPGDDRIVTSVNATTVQGEADLTFDGTTLAVTGDISGSGNISGSFFYGDGSNLTNLPAGSPAGINTQVQFNADGAFGADNALTWASGSNTLTVSGTVEVNEIQFDTAHVATGHTTGRLYWDDDAKTITADMQGSDVRLQIGQEEHVYVQNASGVDIDNGDAVRIVGAAGVNIRVEKAISEIRPFTSPVEQDAILGLATEDIPNNQFGYITVFGQVRDLNTSGFATGDILYLSHTTSGSYTNTKPPAPYFDARVGIVEVVNATTGVILARPAEPLFLTDIASITSSNVPAGAPSYLCYDDTTNIASFTNELSGAFSGSFQGDGSGLANLNASNISAGTLDNTRLPATISVTNVTASALVSSSFFYGDGSNLTNLPSAAITTYNSASAGRIITSVDATTVEGEENLTFDNTTLIIIGDVSGSGNISGSAFYGDGANLADLNASNVSAGTLDNARLPSTISVTNVTASSLISASFFYGDGSNLTNLPAGSPAGSNTQIQYNADGAFGSDADFTWASGSNTLTVTGDISASINISGSDFYGGGANLTDLNASNVSAGTLDNARLPTTISVTNVTASTLVSASAFYGDASNLTGLPVQNYNNATDNYIITAADSNTIQGEPNLTFDGTTLRVTADITGSGTISGSAFYGDGSNLTNLPSAAITTYNNPTDNYIVTAVNATTVQGEANLQFDGTTLAVTGDISGSGNISGSFFYGDGSNLTNLPGGGSPGGSNTQIQFNDGGTFGGDSDLTWDKTSNILTITGSTELNGPLISSYNSTKIKEVSSQSDFDQPLVANTSYVVRGEVTLTTSLTASSDGISIEGNDRNVDKIIWAGASGSACIKVEDAEFSLSNVGFSSSVDGNSILSASNYTGGAYNEGRLKVFSIVNCQFRGCSDIADFIGFDLIDVSNTLFWYSTAPSFGLRFSSTSKTEISSCEFIRWFDESEIPSPATFASASMVEFMPSGSRAGFGAVNINGCVLHPQLSQNGIKINPGSATGFGTIAANTFVDANLGPGLKFFPDPLAGGYSNTECLKYDISVNQGIPNSIAYGMGYFSGSVLGQSAATFTLVDVNSNFNEANSQRISVSNTGEMTYDGTKDIYVTIAAAITMVAGGNSADIEFALFKSSSAGGNVQLSGSSGRAKLKTSGDVATVPLLYSTTLASGDKIGVYYDALAQDFDLENLTLSIKE